jgi:arylsulfatase A
VELAGGELDTSIKIDGKSFAPSLRGETIEHRDEYPFYHRGTLEALRVGDWKLHFKKNKDDCNELYNLRDDVGEENNVFDANPEKVVEILTRAEVWRKALGDAALDIKGDERRPIGEVKDPKPLTEFDENHPYYLAEYDLSEGG